MLDIPKAKFVISDVHPGLKQDDDELTQVCQSKLVISSEGQAAEILKALHMEPFLGALFSKDGKPISEWADVRTRYRITNVQLEIKADGLFDNVSVKLNACTLGKSRIVAKPGFGLDLITTIDNPISSKELAGLFDLRMATMLYGSVKQIQNSDSFPQT